MSLTEEITALVSETRSLIDVFNEKSDTIDASLARLEAAETMASKWVYVDSVNGNDEGTGTITDPYLTIEKALAATADNISVLINLLNDTVMMDRSVNVGARVLRFQGRDSSNNVVSRSLSFASEAVTSPRWSGHRQCAGIEMAGPAFIQFTSIDLVIPNCGEEITFPYCLYGAQSLDVILRSCSISIADAASVADLFSVYYPASAGLWFSTVTVDSGVEGHFLNGISAGADPNTDASNRFRSNLTSL
ncbi:hypothetical protein [uncultured Cohaesibacter sp.]|uniref:hypothetical protein n=1 Tax=uncultured Cohaesibacter sp. TaxID=1002546 RepID=UPI002AAB0FD7|nr:hypothetical protein [uncultured Cohaesibacter sp.]